MNYNAAALSNQSGFKSVKIAKPVNVKTVVSKGLTKVNNDAIIKEIREIKGFKTARIHIPPEEININELEFDFEHINGRGHDVTEKMAHEYIKNAVVFITKRGGLTKNYYSHEGGCIY